MIKFLFSATLFAFSLSALAQFQICNSNTNNNLHDVYFIDSLVGIAVGDSGTILRTTDGGLNWILILSVDTVSFSKVKFFDNQNGMAIGTDLYRTSNAGQTWQQAPNSNTNFIDIEIVNDSTCYISGTPVPLIKSTDGGLTFTPLIFTPNPDLGLMSFVNDTVGYACAYSGGLSTVTLKTTDGGMTWNKIKDSVSSPNPTVMEAISFVSKNIGFKGGWYNGHFQKTINGSQLWNQTTFIDTLSQRQLLDFHIESNMPNAYYACGWYGELYKSIDGGEHWFTLFSGLSNTTSLYGIYFIDDNTGWVVGAYGSIIKTTSGGIGIHENTVQIDLKIYPNPAQNIINIVATEGIALQKVLIYDLQGKLIISAKATENGIDISGLPNGVYVLNIETKKGVVNRKFVKE